MPPKRAATTSSCSRGDRRAARARSRHPARTLRERAHHSRRAASHRRRTARRRQGVRGGLRHRLQRGNARQVRDRALDAAARRGGAGQRIRYRDPVLDRSTLVVAISQSGETADTLEAVRHAMTRRRACWRSATPTVHRFHASPTPCCNARRTRDRRGVDEVFPRADRRRPPGGSGVAQARGTKYSDGVAREFRELEAMPASVTEVLATMDPVRELA